MKSLCKITLIASAFMLATPLVSTVKAQQGYYDDGYYNNGSYQTFYNELSPYGEWIYDGNYGYVWVPDVDRNFRPYYTNGYWAMTNYGNTWVSNYNWGWATFHYGRWYYDGYYGWVWIPGNEWAPAWVNWRGYGDYYGWAPMGPGMNTAYYSNGYYAPDFWWTFAAQIYLYNVNLYNFCRPTRYYSNYLHHSHHVNYSENYNGGRYFSGPRRTDIERSTGRRIAVQNVSDTRKPGASRVANGEVTTFRPRITANSGSNVRPTRVQQGSIRISNDINAHTGTRTSPERFSKTNNGMEMSTQQRSNMNPVNSNVNGQAPAGRANDRISNRVNLGKQSSDNQRFIAPNGQDETPVQNSRFHQADMQRQQTQQQLQQSTQQADLQRQQTAQQAEIQRQQAAQQRQQAEQQRQQAAQQAEAQRQQAAQQRQQAEQQRQQAAQQAEIQRQQAVQQRQQAEQQRQQAAQQAEAQRQQAAQQRQQAAPQRQEQSSQNQPIRGFRR